MYSPSKIAIVIPTLREAGNLRPLLEALRASLAGVSLAWEIIVVDDDSRDGTEELVLVAVRRDARVRLLVRRNESGLAGAILHGWQNTDATILGVMDADMQHPPAALPELIAELLRGNDVAIASRYAKGSAPRAWNPVRRAISAASVWLTLPVQRRKIRVADPLSGFFLVRRHCIEGLAFKPCGFKLLLEILVRGRVGSVSEVPFVFGRREAGASKVGVRVAWDYARLLGELYVFTAGRVGLRRRAVEG